MNRMWRRFGWFVVLALAVALAMPATTVLSTATFAEESKQEKQADKAVKEAQAGWTELDKVDKKLSEDKAKEAVKHFNDAISHFTKALDYLGESMLSDDQQEGVDKLDKGAKELDKAAKELDKGDIDSAQTHFDDAVALLQEGMDMLEDED